MTTFSVNLTIPKLPKWISEYLPTSEQINEVERNLAEFIDVKLPDLMDQGKAFLEKNNINLIKAVSLLIVAPIAITLAIKMVIAIINAVLTMAILLAVSLAAGYFVFLAVQPKGGI